MERRVRPPQVLEGEVIPPGDKSISHRAAILNSLARGKATVTNYSSAADCLSTLACLRGLGVEISTSPGLRDSLTLAISGSGGQLQEPSDVLDAGNSGTTIRLLSGVLAAQPFLSIITGDASLRSRPMDRVIQPLRLMGAQIWGRQGDSRPPLAIKGGSLRGIHYRLPVASAQVKSALLLAGLFARDQNVLEEPVPTRDHTERLLRAMGARVEAAGGCLTLSPSSLHALDITVPADISGAAFWLVAGAIHPQARLVIRDTGLNPTRTGILEALGAMGARIRVEGERQVGGEPIADLIVESSSLRGIEIGGDLIPRLIDEIPVLAVAAAAARGTTLIRDASELRVKETDRISTTVKELRRLGADLEERPDGMVIHGGRALQGTSCQSYGDHRLAMALGVAGLIAKGETIIYNAEAADVSYPGFWRVLERIAQF